MEFFLRHRSPFSRGLPLWITLFSPAISYAHPGTLSHGHPHGYGIGFILATALLLICGIGLGLLARRRRAERKDQLL